MANPYLRLTKEESEAARKRGYQRAFLTQLKNQQAAEGKFANYENDYIANWHSQEDLDRYFDDMSGMKSYLQTYRDYLSLYGTDEQKSTLPDLDSALEKYGSVLSQRDAIKGDYARYESAEDWQAAVDAANAYNEEQARLLALNVDELRAQSERIDSLIKDSKQSNYHNIWPRSQVDDEKVREWKSEKSAMDAEIAAAERAQRMQAYSELSGAEDFDALSVYDEKEMRDPLYRKVNGKTDGYFQHQVLELLERGEIEKYSYLNDEERGIFNYLARTQGKESASQFLSDMSDVLNQRQAGAWAENVKGNALLEILASVPIGVDQFASGLRGLFGDTSTSPMQYLSGHIREDMEDNVIGRTIYDLGTTTGNMLPSVLVGSVTGGVGGAVTMGASAAGNGYAEMKNLGYSDEQAMAYGVFIGVSETALSTILSGVSALGGKATGHAIAKAIAKVDNGLAKAAIQIGGKVLSEGLEEAAQEALDPIFREIATGEDVEGIDWGEVAYSALLGALSAGMLEGPGVVANTRATYAKGKNLQGVGKSQDMLNLAKAYHAETDTAKIRGRAEAKGGSFRLGNLLETMNRESLGKTQSEIMESLQKRGISEKAARRAAKEILAGRGSLLSLNVDAATNQKKLSAARTKALENVPEAMRKAQSEAKTLTVQKDGADVTTTTRPKISSVEGDSISEVFLDVEGKKTAADSLSFADSDLSLLYAYVPTLGSVKAANSFIQSWNGNTAPDHYWTEWMLFQSRGELAPGGYERLAAERKNMILSEVQRLAAFKSGVELSQEVRKERREKLDAVVAEYRKGGKKMAEGKMDSTDVRREWEHLTKEQKEYYHFLQMLPKAMGVNVRVVVSQKGSRGDNGSYNRNTNTLTIDLNAGINNKDNFNALRSSFLHTLSHESVHWMAINAPKEYGVLRDAVMGYLAEKGDVESRVNARLDKMKEYDPKATKEDAVEEIVARSCEDFFAGSEKIRGIFEEMAKKDKSVPEKFKEGLGKILHRIRTLFDKFAATKSYSDDAIAVQKMGEKVTTELRTLYEEAFTAAIEGSTARTATVTETKKAPEGEMRQEREEFVGITSEDVEILRSIGRNGRKSINQFTSEEIQKAEPWARKFFGELGTKSPFFRAWFGDWRAYDKTAIRVIEIDQSAVISSGNAINKDMGRKISWSKDIAKESVLNAPKKYKDDMSHISANIGKIVEKAILFDTVVSEKSSDRKLDGTAWMHSLYCVVSLNGKTSLVKLFAEEAFSQKQDMVFTRAYSLKHIEKIAEFDNGVLSHAGGLTDSHSTTVYSISDLFELVKRYDKNFSPEPVNRYMLNADGTPKVFYHGSTANFTVFDIKKAKSSGLYGKGFYFTDSNTHAGQYGSLYSCYLNLKNPLKENESTATREQVKRYLEEVAENEDYSIENYGTYDVNQVLALVMDGREQKDIYAVLNDINATAIGDLVEAVKLFNRVNDTDFDGIVVPTEVVAFYPTPIKSATDNIGTFDGENSDIMHQRREETPEASEVLRKLFSDNAAYADYAAYAKSLEGYQELLDRAEHNERRVAKIDVEIKALKSQRKQSGKGTEMYNLFKQKEVYERRAAEARRRMTEMEAGKLKKVVDAEIRRAVEQRAREEREIARERSKERTVSVSKRVYIERIQKCVSKLENKIRKNSAKEHIPDAFKAPILELLTAIDFSSESKISGGKETQKDQRFAASLDELARELVKWKEKPEELTMAGLDLPENLYDDFIELNERVRAITEGKGKDYPDRMILREMSVEDLAALNRGLEIISHAVSDAGKLIANARFQKIEEAATSSMRSFQKYRQHRQGKSLVKDFLEYQNILPAYYFERLGDAAKSMYDSMLDGQEKLAFLVREIVDFAEHTYTTEQAKEWAGDVRRVTLNGTEVYMTVPQLMYLRCLAKREQGKKHLFGGGASVETIDEKILKSAAKKAGVEEIQNAVEGFRLREEDLLVIERELSNEQMRVADALQDYMVERGGALGNEISMIRFGTRLFNEAHYMPIFVDPNARTQKDADHGKPAKAQNKSDLYRLINISATHSLQEQANARVLIRDIFDVFSEHMSDMALYNSFCLPLLDILKWYNYTELDADGNKIILKDGIRHAFGEGAQRYLVNFMSDINNAQSLGRGEEFSKKMASNYKIAAVAANLRVALLQPTSYIRAAAVLNIGDMEKAVLSVSKIRRGIRKAQKYSGMALWKSLGYYDLNVSSSVTAKIKHTDTLRDKVVDASLKPAEWGDKITWGVLWNACERDVSRSQPNLTYDSESYNQAVSKRFREVIVKTQVMDSVLTRSDIMRSKSGITQAGTSFMSEPTVTYNMLWSIKQEYDDTKRRGEAYGKRRLAKKIGRVASVFVAGVMCQSLMESLVDAMRNDDEEKDFGQKYVSELWENLLSELNLLDSVPFMKELDGVVKESINLVFGTDISTYGGSSSRMDTAYIEAIEKAIRKLAKFAEEPIESIYAILDALSKLTGLPASNLVRDFTALWNMLIGEINPDLVITLS